VIHLDEKFLAMIVTLPLGRKTDLQQSDIILFSIIKENLGIDLRLKKKRTADAGSRLQAPLNSPIL
jgi:hypothetical protein